MRGAHQTVVIRPQRVAAMLLGAGEVEGVRRAQPEAPAQLGSLQENRLRHGERHKSVEQLTVAAPQNQIAALDRPNQAFALDQRRYSEALFAECCDRTGDVAAPAAMAFDQVN